MGPNVDLLLDVLVASLLRAVVCGLLREGFSPDRVWSLFAGDESSFRFVIDLQGLEIAAHVEMGLGTCILDCLIAGSDFANMLSYVRRELRLSQQ